MHLNISRTLFSRFFIVAAAIILLLHCGPVLAGPQAVLEAGRDEYRSGLQLELLEDPDRRLTIGDVSGPDYRHRFEPVSSRETSLGYPRSVYWARLRLRNADHPVTSWYLQIHSLYVNDVRLYVPANTDTGFTRSDSGNQLPITERPIYSPYPVFPLSIPSGQDITIYLRLDNQNLLLLPLRLFTEQAYLNFAHTLTMLRYAFYSIMLFMMLYYLLTALLLRDQSHAFFAFFIGAMVIVHGLSEGVIQSVWPAIPPDWVQRCAFAVLGLQRIFALAFAIGFLDTRRHTPFWHRVILGLIACNAAVVAAIVVLSVPYIELTSLVTFSLTQANFIVFISVGILLCLKRHRPAYYYLTAWLSTIVVVTWMFLARIGLLSANSRIENIYPAAMIWMVFLIALALADQIIGLRKAQEKAHARELDMVQENERLVREQNIELEHQVAERTGKLVEARDAAQAASRSKSAFLANMSHEVRTPMHAIIGLSDLLLNRNLPAACRDDLRQINRSARSLLRLLDDILDLARIESGVLRLEAVSFDLKPVLAQVAELTRLKIHRKSLGYIAVIDPEVPGRLLGDPFRLGQILLNLVNNAIKFTDIGEIQVRVSLRSSSEDTRVLLFSVSNTGSGLPEQYLPHIFEAFSQADESTTRQHGGSGLGLAICRQLVELMHGDVWAENRPEGGSRFSFTVAFKLPDPNAAAVTSEAGIRADRKWEDTPAMSITSPLSSKLPAIGDTTDEAPADPFPANPATDTSPAPPAEAVILLVDDNDINRRIARETLSTAGYIVQEARNGWQAVAAVATFPCHLVLMDVQMPGMDGYQTTTRIRETGNTVPIIALTARAMTAEKEHCLKVGMNDHISKPYLPSHLLNTVRQWLPDSVRLPASPVLEVNPARSGRELPPDPPGIDLDLGLERSNHNWPLYCRLLAHFAQKNRSLMPEFKNRMARDDWEALRLRAHSLKSNAHSLGATALGQVAADLEQALDTDPHQVDDRLLNPVEERLAEVLVSIDTLAPAPTGTDEPSDNTTLPNGERREEVMEALRQALIYGNTRASEIFITLSRLLPEPHVQGYLQRIEAHIRELDFDAARSVLDDMSEE